MECYVRIQVYEVYQDSNGNNLSDFTLSSNSENGSVLDGNDVLYNEDFVFEKRDILELEIMETIVTDNTKPQFGIVGQYGSMRLKDSSLRFIDFVKSHKETSYFVSISFNNSFYNQLYLIKKIDIDDERFEVGISLEDRTEMLKTISHTPLVPNIYNAWDLLVQATEDIEKNLGLSDFSILCEQSTSTILSNIELANFKDSEFKNVYDFLNAICQSTHCCIFITNDGLEVVMYE